MPKKNVPYAGRISKQGQQSSQKTVLPNQSVATRHLQDNSVTEDKLTTATRKPNYIINGNFDFWQRYNLGVYGINGTRRVTDKFLTIFPTNGGYNMFPAVSPPIPHTETGFRASTGAAFGITSIPTLNATDLVALRYTVEGTNLSSLAAADNNITLSFWVSCSIPGTYSLSFGSKNDTRTYITEYVINQMNTWEYKSVTIPLDNLNSGNWFFDNDQGMRIYWTLDAGINNKTATLNTWQTGSLYASGNQTAWSQTTSNAFVIALVSLVPGKKATPFKRAGGTHAEELMLCQRYYEKSYDTNINPGTLTYDGSIRRNASGSNNYIDTIEFKVKKRVLAIYNIIDPSGTGAYGTVRNVTQGSPQSIASVGVNTTVATFQTPAHVPVTGDLMAWHWTADADF